MNKRIQELAEQAEDYAYSAVVGGDECQEVFIQKFAELLINECISAHMEDYGIDIIGDVLNKHFGTEQ